MSENKIQCPCGVYIKDNQYKLLYLKKDIGEIDILCYNDLCYLKELGYLKFHVDELQKINFNKGRFYSPFVTWNATRMSEEKASDVLKRHLIFITENLIDWQKVIEDYKANIDKKREKETS